MTGCCAACRGVEAAAATQFFLRRNLWSLSFSLERSLLTSLLARAKVVPHVYYIIIMYMPLPLLTCTDESTFYK